MTSGTTVIAAGPVRKQIQRQQRWFKVGNPKAWWACAVEGYCSLRSEADEMADGVTFDEQVLLVGANVSYKSISSKNESRLHQFGKKMLTEVFTRSVLHAEDGQATCSWQIAKIWKTCPPPKSTSKE